MSCRVKGFKAAGVTAGIKESGAPDLALIVSDAPCSVAGMFTSNRVRAACVDYNQQIVAGGKPVRAVVINSGNANACTGEQGVANTFRMAEKAAECIGCDPFEVLILSTGVIGVQLPLEKIEAGIEQAAASLREAGWEEAARAIMTTDTRPKIAGRAGDGWAIAGIAKGSGMIAPNMATMLGIMATDAAVRGDEIGGLLRGAVNESFNRIVVDGDMSTNDTVLLLANGAAGSALELEALNALSRDLAQSIVRDGEGATKFVEVRISGAQSEADAVLIARAIATSPLCKTAFHGADPNWGRVLAAAGRSGAEIDPACLSLWLAGISGAEQIHLVEAGVPLSFSEAAASGLMQGAEWQIHLDLGLGRGQALFWTCDLSHEYVTINADYRT